MIKKILKKIYRYGLVKSFKIAFKSPRLKYWNFVTRKAPIYKPPASIDLQEIEEDLQKLGVNIIDYSPRLQDFDIFQDQKWFSIEYHGGINGGVWHEKVLEHWIASEKLGLMDFNNNDVYIDIAASGSPWAKKLRERKNIKSFAIDLQEIGDAYSDLHYYRIEDATRTSFDSESVKGVSLQCAFEMFMGDDDVNLIHELFRILKPGGKAIILPLYMHKEYCGYASPEYYEKGFFDSGASKYVRREIIGIPFSRKYSAKVLKIRILNTIESLGLKFKIYALRNKEEFGNGIYCHFILEIEK